MKFLMSWLNDYVDLSDLEPAAWVDGVQLPNGEAAAVTLLQRYLEGVVVGEIKTFACVCQDKGLFMVEVDGGGVVQRAVSGLPNLRPGLKTAFAVLGTGLANGLFVELREVEGVETAGRICTAADLGLGAFNEKAIELPGAMENGTTLEGLMTANDALLEIGGRLTNQPDVIDGHRDLARKLSLGLGCKQRLSLQQPFETAVSTWTTQTAGRPKTPEAKCLGADATVAVPSPFWLQGRLCAMGIEPLGLTEDLAHYARFDGVGLQPIPEKRLSDARKANSMNRTVELASKERSTESCLDFGLVFGDHDRYLDIERRLDRFESPIPNRREFLFKTCHRDLPPDAVCYTVRFRFDNGSEPVSIDDRQGFQQSFYNWLNREGIRWR